MSESLTSTVSIELCPECGYSLAGLAIEGACPECGHPYDRDTRLFRINRSAEANLVAVVAVCCAFAQMFCLSAGSVGPSVGGLIVAILLVALGYALRSMLRRRGRGAWIAVTPSALALRPWGGRSRLIRWSEIDGLAIITSRRRPEITLLFQNEALYFRFFTRDAVQAFVQAARRHYPRVQVLSQSRSANG